jgi:hypothetical protein
VVVCGESFRNVKTIGELNIIQAQKTLKRLVCQLPVPILVGRGAKIFFVKTGDVYLGELGLNKGTCDQELLP